MSEKPWYKFWPSAVPKSIDYPKITIPQLLERAVSGYPDNTAIIFYGNKISYRQLGAYVDAFASALQDMGVSKGDRVALYLPNLPQFVIAYYGALKAGAVVTCCSPLYAERELEYQLSDSGAETLIALDMFYDKVQAIRDEVKLENVITTSIPDFLPGIKRLLAPLKGIKKHPCPGSEDMMEVLKSYEGSVPKKVEVSYDELALLQYTGGTTGVPKGAMLTHYNLLVNAIQAAHWLFTAETGKERFLTVLPLFHIYGMTTSMNAPIYLASTMVLLPRFDVEEVMKTIEKYRVTVFCGVPTMYIGIINHPRVTKFNLRSIKACISGAAPLPMAVIKRFHELTGGVLVEGYGLTEASPVTHCNPLELDKVREGSIGIPVSDTEAFIVDLETGEKSLPPGEVGELAIRGPQVMKGYWNRPDETAKTLKGGLLLTGDIAYMDEDGYFYVVDRKKDMINVSGFKVCPREVEEVLYEHPAVKEVAVIGVPDPRSGEAVKAYVALKEEYEGKVTAEELIEFCRERLAKYKIPKQIEFRLELPKTAAGKILRRAIREEELGKA